MEPCQLMLLFDICVCIADTTLRPCLNSPVGIFFRNGYTDCEESENEKRKDCDQNGYLNDIFSVGCIKACSRDEKKCSGWVKTRHVLPPNC